MRIGRRNLEKTCPSTTLSTTNPTWPHLGLNLGRTGRKPPTNHLTHGIVIVIINNNNSSTTLSELYNAINWTNKNNYLPCTVRVAGSLSLMPTMFWAIHWYFPSSPGRTSAIMRLPPSTTRTLQSHKIDN
jgi:hypothetical protein